MRICLQYCLRNQFENRHFAECLDRGGIHNDLGDLGGHIVLFADLILVDVQVFIPNVHSRKGGMQRWLVMLHVRHSNAH